MTARVPVGVWEAACPKVHSLSNLVMACVRLLVVFTLGLEEMVTPLVMDGNAELLAPVSGRVGSHLSLDMYSSKATPLPANLRCQGQRQYSRLLFKWVLTLLPLHRGLVLSSRAAV